MGPLNVTEFNSFAHIELIAKHLINRTWVIGGEKYNAGRSGYRFEWDSRSTVRFGVCNYKTKVIKLSSQLCDVNFNNIDEVMDTILHEIAHALAVIKWGYHGRGHGKPFKVMARAIGSRGETYYDSKRVIPVKTNEERYKWVATCPSCGYQAKFTRKPKKSRSCGKCCPVYNPEYKMVLTEINK